MTKEQEQILEERMRHGDCDALAQLFSQHRERLWRVANFRLAKKLKSRIDPEDILQESYMAAAQRLQHYKEDSPSAFVWLRMIVIQTMTDLYRKHLGAKGRNVEREVQAHRWGYSQATSASMAIQLIGNLTTPSKAAMRAELTLKLEQAIEGMEPIDQEILALRHFEELSNKEVAEVLGIEQKAASIRYFRALKRLKNILADVSGITLA